MRDVPSNSYGKPIEWKEKKLKSMDPNQVMEHVLDLALQIKRLGNTKSEAIKLQFAMGSMSPIFASAIENLNSEDDMEEITTTGQIIKRLTALADGNKKPSSNPKEVLTNLTQGTNESSSAFIERITMAITSAVE
jgi:hypothetical protein